MALCGKSERKFITSVSSESKEVGSGVGSLLLLSIPGSGQEDWGCCHGEGHQAERRDPPPTAGAAHWEQLTRSESDPLGRKTEAVEHSSPTQPRKSQANLEWGSKSSRTQNEIPSTSDFPDGISRVSRSRFSLNQTKLTRVGLIPRKWVPNWKLLIITYKISLWRKLGFCYSSLNVSITTVDLPNHSNMEMGQVGTVVFTWNSHPLEVEGVWLRVPGQPGLHGERMELYWLFIHNRLIQLVERNYPTQDVCRPSHSLVQHARKHSQEFFFIVGMQLRSKMLTIAWICHWPLSFRLDPFTYLMLQLCSLTSGPSPFKPGTQRLSIPGCFRIASSCSVKNSMKTMRYWAWS